MPTDPNDHPYNCYPTPLMAHASEIANHGTAWAVKSVFLSRGAWEPHKILGAVAPRSLATGNVLWGQRNAATERMVEIDPEDHERWVVERWEPATGLCYECRGDGEVLAHVVMLPGQGRLQTAYATCLRCGGTGSSGSVKAARP